MSSKEAVDEGKLLAQQSCVALCSRIAEACSTGERLALPKDSFSVFLISRFAVV